MASTLEGFAGRRSRVQSGSVALVTGASKGLGRQIAERLAIAGFRTFGTSRSTADLVSGIQMTPLDVQDPRSVRSCVDGILEDAGRIDVLVNNAGIVQIGPAEELSVDRIPDVFETNYFGAVRMTNAVLPSMRAQRAGRIIQIGSLAGLLPTPGEAAYAASKAALASHSDALRQEVLSFGIHVSVVEPGFHRTAIAADLSQPTSTIDDYDIFRAAILDAMVRGVAEGGDPADVAELVSRVARSRRPRSRYRIGTDAVWLPRLRRVLPEALFELGLRHNFGI